MQMPVGAPRAPITLGQALGLFPEGNGVPQPAGCCAQGRTPKLAVHGEGTEMGGEARCQPLGSALTLSPRFFLSLFPQTPKSSSSTTRALRAAWRPRTRWCGSPRAATPAPQPSSGNGSRATASSTWGPCSAWGCRGTGPTPRPGCTPWPPTSATASPSTCAGAAAASASSSRSTSVPARAIPHWTGGTRHAAHSGGHTAPRRICAPCPIPVTPRRVLGSHSAPWVLPKSPAPHPHCLGAQTQEVLAVGLVPKKEQPQNGAEGEQPQILTLSGSLGLQNQVGAGRWDQPHGWDHALPVPEQPQPPCQLPSVLSLSLTPRVEHPLGQLGSVLLASSPKSSLCTPSPSLVGQHPKW